MFFYKIIFHPDDALSDWSQREVEIRNKRYPHVCRLDSGPILSDCRHWALQNNVDCFLVAERDVQCPRRNYLRFRTTDDLLLYMMSH